MKNKKIKKNIYIAGSIFLTLILSYIICIYKTVVLASALESNAKSVAALEAEINQKEFEFIGKISELDIEKAISLGYQKNTHDKVAYATVNTNNEFALR